MRYLLFCLLFMVFEFAIGQVDTRSFLEDPNRIPREHTVDMQHAKIELRFSLEKKRVMGKVTHTFVALQNNLTKLELDGIDITYKSILLDGQAVGFQENEKSVTIKLGKNIQRGEEHTVQIEYEATPFKGLYFIGWDDPKNISRKQIWSQGQGIDNRHWIPMYDEMNDKIVSEMLVTFDSQYKVLSNGEKIKAKKNKDGTTLWHYKISHPHSPYLIMLGIGDYAIRTSKSKNGTPMHFWYYPDWEDRLEPTYRNSEDMVDFFEETIGVQYPWESYSQIPVQEFMYGAMENTTATIFGDFFCVDERAFLDRNYVSVNAHELAHQWFGDYVTARSSAHHWLQESFATHYNMLYEKRFFGKDHFDWQRRQGNNGALKASMRDYKPIAHSEAGSTRHYPKGAFVLNMLRYVVGDEEFNLAVKHYLETHPYQNVDSEDLLIAFHEALGVSLDWFWDQWVYRGGEPHYKVSYADLNEGGQRFTQFDISQVHEQNEIVGLFKMPIWLEVHYTDGTSDAQQEWIDEKRELVRINNIAGKDIAFVLFDPNNEVMKKVEFKKSFDELAIQTLAAPMMLDRYDALVGLRSYPIERKEKILARAFRQEKFHAVKSEVVAQMAGSNSVLANGILLEAIKDEDVMVRKAVALNLREIPEYLIDDYEQLLKDSSYQVVELSLRKLCTEFPEKTQNYLDVTENEVGAIAKNVRLAWLEYAYNTTQEKKHVDELVEYTSNSYEFKTRVGAAETLKRLNYCDATLLDNLIQSMGSANSRLVNPMRKVFQYFYAQTRWKHEIDVLVRNGEWSEQQLKRLNSVMR